VPARSDHDHRFCKEKGQSSQWSNSVGRRERIVAVEPRGTGMALFTLRDADEARAAQFGDVDGDLDAEMVAIARPQLSAWAPSFDGEWWLLEPSQHLYWFAEADDYPDDTAAPRVDRPQLGRSLEAATYLARNRKFESIPLQQRVCEPSVPQGIA
jgi:hypothetical protein